MDSLSAVSSTSIPFFHIMRASYSGGRISVPVSELTGIYARFKHITGIPSFSESRTVPYNRLKQLDTLIDQISRMKNRDVTVDLENSDREEVENLINRFSGELRNRLNANSTSVNYYQGIYSPGSILDLTA